MFLLKKKKKKIIGSCNFQTFFLFFAREGIDIYNLQSKFGVYIMYNILKVAYFLEFKPFPQNFEDYLFPCNTLKVMSIHSVLRKGVQ